MTRHRGAAPPRLPARQRGWLLVLDTCEHLVDGPAPGFAGHRAARPLPVVTLLATSRQPLDAQGEHVFPLRPLAPPSMTRRTLFRTGGGGGRWSPGFTVTPAEPGRTSVRAVPAPRRPSRSRSRLAGRAGCARCRLAELASPAGIRDQDADGPAAAAPVPRQPDPARRGGVEATGCARRPEAGAVGAPLRIPRGLFDVRGRRAGVRGTTPCRSRRSSTPWSALVDKSVGPCGNAADPSRVPGWLAALRGSSGADPGSAGDERGPEPFLDRPRHPLRRHGPGNSTSGSVAAHPSSTTAGRVTGPK